MNSFEEYVKNTATPKPHDMHPETLQDKHRKAADVHERAFRHHREAARLYEKGDHNQAHIHSNIACAHTQTALHIELTITG